jgi:DNA-binding CsgD family transcriptional regulator
MSGCLVPGAAGFGCVSDPFVGRAEELARLMRAADSAAAGVPGLVLVEGDAGIGKTALLRKLLEQLPPYKVLRATADRHERDFPGAVLSQLLAGLEPTACTLPGLDGGPLAATPFSAGMQMTALLQDLQQDAPVALVVDDTQWTDTFSMRALLFVLRRLRTERIVTIFAVRSQPSEVKTELTSFLQAHPHGVHVSLSGLRRWEVDELAREVLGQRLSTEQVTRLHAQSRGHALFTRTLLADTAWRESLEADQASTPPQRLVTAIEQLLASLPPECRRLADALAVLDSRVPLSRAAQLAGLPTEAVTRALQAGLQAGLLDWWPQEPTTPITLRHGLQRDAVYALIQPEQRQYLHRAAADVTGGVAALGHRVAATSGADVGLAAELDSAAALEITEGRHAVAGTLLLWAAELSETRPDHERRLLAAALALLTANKARQALHRQRDIEGCAPGLLRDLIVIVMQAFAGRAREVGRLAPSAMHRLQTDASAKDVAQRIGYLLPWALHIAGRVTEVADYTRWALGDGRLDPQTASGMLTLHSGAVCVTEGPDAALLSMTQQSHLQIEPVPQHADAIGARGVWRVVAGALDSGLQDLHTAMEYTRAGAPLIVCRRLWGYAAWAYFLRGDWDKAVPTATTAIDEAVAGGYAFDYPFEYLVGMFVPTARGQWSQAAQLLDSLERSAAPLGDAGQLLTATGRALIAQTRADHEEMYQSLAPWHDRLITHVDIAMTERWWRPLLLEAEIGTGRFAQAEETLRRLEADGHVPYLRTQVRRLHGWMRERQGHLPEAMALYESAAAPVAQDDAPFYRGLAHLSAGRLHLHDGHRKQAIAHLQKARDIMAVLHANPYTEQCEAFLVQCGLKRSTPTGSGHLTGREQEIAWHVKQGRTNREIAQQLYLSPKTVEFHLGNVYTKLGISGRTALRQLLQSHHLTVSGRDA